MKSNIDIRQCEDPALIARLNEPVQTLHHQLFPHFFKPYEYEGIHEVTKQVMANHNVYAFVAYLEAEPVGYVLCVVKYRADNAFQYAGKSVYIDQIAVDANHRGKGVGQKLIARALELAFNLDIGLVQLDHWTLNEEAGAFFQKQGFRYYNQRMEITVPL